MGAKKNKIIKKINRIKEKWGKEIFEILKPSTIKKSKKRKKEYNSVYGLGTHRRSEMPRVATVR
jgi:hypothetical protein